jgi:hypothetical protein
MATLKINLIEQQIDALTAKAAAQGLTLEGWLQKMAEQEVLPHPSPLCKKRTRGNGRGSSTHG